jgi:hypothetical protein
LYAQNDLPPVLSGSIPRIHDSTLFEKCQDLSITHKNYNNLRIIFNTANPKLAHFNIREINEISLESILGIEPLSTGGKSFWAGISICPCD